MLPEQQVARDSVELELCAKEIWGCQKPGLRGGIATES